VEVPPGGYLQLHPPIQKHQPYYNQVTTSETHESLQVASVLNEMLPWAVLPAPTQKNPPTTEIDSILVDTAVISIYLCSLANCKQKAFNSMERLVLGNVTAQYFMCFFAYLCKLACTRDLDASSWPCRVIKVFTAVPRLFYDQSTGTPVLFCCVSSCCQRCLRTDLDV
jgi:hypothetical protein